MHPLMVQLVQARLQYLRRWIRLSIHPLCFGHHIHKVFRPQKHFISNWRTVQKVATAKVTETRTILPFDTSPSTSTSTWFVDRFVCSTWNLIRLVIMSKNLTKWMEKNVRYRVVGTNVKCESNARCLPKSPVCTYWTSKQSESIAWKMCSCEIYCRDFRPQCMQILINYIRLRLIYLHTTIPKVYANNGMCARYANGRHA